MNMSIWRPHCYICYRTTAQSVRTRLCGKATTVILVGPPVDGRGPVRCAAAGREARGEQVMSDAPGRLGFRGPAAMSSACLSSGTQLPGALRGQPLHEGPENLSCAVEHNRLSQSRDQQLNTVCLHEDAEQEQSPARDWEHRICPPQGEETYPAEDKPHVAARSVAHTCNLVIVVRDCLAVPKDDEARRCGISLGTLHLVAGLDLLPLGEELPHFCGNKVSRILCPSVRRGLHGQRLAMTASRVKWPEVLPRLRKDAWRCGMAEGLGLELLAGSFAERLQGRLLDEVCAPNAECLEFLAVNPALYPLVYRLARHGRVDKPAGFLDAVVFARFSVIGPSLRV